MPLPRFQFRLRTLFVVVTVLSIPCTYIGWQAKVVRERKALLAELSNSGDGYITEATGFDLYAYGQARQDFYPECRISLIRTWLGDEPIFEIDYFPHLPPTAVARIHESFPEVVWWDNAPRH